MEKITPKESQIETIRYYQQLPEKMYRRKILIILLLDLIMVFIFMQGRELLIMLNETNIIYSPKTVFLHSIGSFMDLFAFENILATGVIVLVYLGLFLLPIVVFLILVYAIPGLRNTLLGFSKKLTTVLNPFNSKKNANTTKAEKWDFTNLYQNKDAQMVEQNKSNLEAYNDEKKAREKTLRKSEPFISFRESKIGRATRGYFVFLHVMIYLNTLTIYLKKFYTYRSTSIILQSFFVMLFINMIAYYLLTKEPARTMNIAHQNLRIAFHYYFSPQGKAQLTPLEKAKFEENFKGSSSNHEYHQKGYFKNGVYQNQQSTYEATVYVEDLKTGHKHHLTYPTDRSFENWGLVTGKETLTRRGRFSA